MDFLMACSMDFYRFLWDVCVCVDFYRVLEGLCRFLYLYFYILRGTPPQTRQVEALLRRARNCYDIPMDVYNIAMSFNIGCRLDFYKNSIRFLCDSMGCL